MESHIWSLSMHITCNLKRYNLRLQSSISLSIQAIPTDYSKMSSDSAATNSFLIINAPTRTVLDNKRMKTTGAVSWDWDYFSMYDPKYNFVALYRTVYVFGTLDLDRKRTWTSLQDSLSCITPHYEFYLRL